MHKLYTPTVLTRISISSIKFQTNLGLNVSFDGLDYNLRITFNDDIGYLFWLISIIASQIVRVSANKIK